MPLYDFVCQECEHSFETLTRTGQSVNCPKCQSEQVQRMLPLPARPPSESPGPGATGCRSQGPPCGPMCSRFKE